MDKEFKIYTKTGDKGMTSLLGGRRVPKYHDRIEAYGTLDELNSFIGLLRDQDIAQEHKEKLTIVQEKIFAAESHLAADSPDDAASLPRIADTDIEMLEKEIDRMNEELPGLRNFVLPGGHPAASLGHVARTVCRRAERLCIRLSENYRIDETIIRFLNRLSDYFFVLSRKILLDAGADEIPWKPGNK